MYKVIVIHVKNLIVYIHIEINVKYHYNTHISIVNMITTHPQQKKQDKEQEQTAKPLQQPTTWAIHNRPKEEQQNASPPRKQSLSNKWKTWKNHIPQAKTGSTKIHKESQQPKPLQHSANLEKLISQATNWSMKIHK